jgi:hypothetical protein
VTWKDVENGIAADAFTMAEPGLEAAKRKRRKR